MGRLLPNSPLHKLWPFIKDDTPKSDALYKLLVDHAELALLIVSSFIGVILYVDQVSRTFAQFWMVSNIFL